MSARSRNGDPSPAAPLSLEFDDYRLLPLLYGEHDQNLARIEQQLGVTLASRGHHLQISGPDEATAAARDALLALYERLEKDLEVGNGEIDAAVRMARAAPLATPGEGHGAKDLSAEDVAIVTRKRRIFPRSRAQAHYIRQMQVNDLAFGIGPAGTGKTYLAVAVAVAQLVRGDVERLILSRPAVEAGERLGFLPGDLLEKVDPYLRPLYDALHDMLPNDQVARHISNGDIEVVPLAFMRGRTLSNAFVILDEAQNTTPVQMKMFLTRLGENSRMAVTGDLTQIDLPRGQPSGLNHALETLGQIDGVSTTRFTEADVVRHSLVSRILEAYARREASEAAAGQGDPRTFMAKESP